MNIPITDKLNMINVYVNSDDQFTNKTVIPQGKFLDLVTPVLTTTWYKFNSKVYHQSHGIAMGKPASLTTEEICLQAHERSAIFLTPYHPEIWNDLLITFILFFNVHTGKKY